MQRQEKWRTIISPLLVDTPFELIGVECIGGGKHTIARVYIDKPGGITMEDIVNLTRQISVVLDVEEPIRGAYTLEVSSPGLERPLFLPAHYLPQVGQKLAVRLKIPLNNRQNFKGLMTKADNNGIELEVEGEVFTFTYDQIDKAKVIPIITIGQGGK